MEDISSLEKIDVIFNYIKEKEIVSVSEIMQGTQPRNINSFEVDLILDKLLVDKYISIKPSPDEPAHLYTITFDGFLFNGYKDQDNIKQETAKRVKRIEKLMLFIVSYLYTVSIIVLIWQILKWGYYYTSFFHWLKFWH